MFIPGNIRLFESIKSEDIENLLSCLGVRQRNFTKGMTILHEGDFVDFIGVVLSGNVQIVRNDIQGNRMIQASFGLGSLFAESFVCAGIERSPVSVIAADDSEILFIPYKNIIHSCKAACVFHHQLIENLMNVIAKKNIFLNSKIEIISKRTIREKILAYLDLERRKNQVDSFTIPFSRNDLADFLCVDRCSLSRELSNLRFEGYISFEGKTFTLRKK